MPNKATTKVKALLDEIFSSAFAREEFKKGLVEQIVDLSIDPKLLGLLLAYYAGRPAVAVDHYVEGSLTLAELIAGATQTGDDEPSRADLHDSVTAGSAPAHEADRD